MDATGIHAGFATRCSSKHLEWYVQQFLTRINAKRPPTGRSVSVTAQHPLHTAYARLARIMSRNRVPRELFLARRHEKKGVKRRRLASDRWRRKFAHEVCSVPPLVCQRTEAALGEEEGAACEGDPCSWGMRRGCIYYGTWYTVYFSAKRMHEKIAGQDVYDPTYGGPLCPAIQSRRGSQNKIHFIVRSRS